MINNIKKQIDKKNNMIIYVFRILLLLLWMGFIFYMSHKDGNASSSQSNFIADILSNIGLEIKNILPDTKTFIIRKAGHLSEYFILSILLYRVFILKMSIKNTRIFAIISTFIYACSDEIHQLFVSGRNGCFRDVLIDTFGGMLAIILLYLISKVKRKSQIQKS